MRAKYMVTSAGGVAMLVTAGMAAQFGVDILAARGMPKADFGNYAFTRQTASLVMSFAFLGLDQAIARVIAKRELSDFAWKTLWLRVVGIASAMVLALTGIFGQVYQLGIHNLLVIAVSSIALVMSALSASMNRANRNFVSGQMLLNGWRYMLMFLTFVAYVSHRLSGTAILNFYVFSVAVGAVFSIVMVARGHQNSTAQVKLWNLYREGFIFWLFLSSLALTNSMDQLMLRKLASLSDVGVYTALWNVIAAPFIVFSSSFGYVALPLVVRGTIRSMVDRRLLVPATAFLFALAAVWFFAAGPAVRLLYAGRYAFTPQLGAVFLVSGLVHAMYVLPSTMLGGRADTRLLLRFLALALLGVLVHAVLDWLLIPKLGVLGAAYGSLANWTIRFSGGLMLVFLYRDKLRTAAPQLELGAEA